MKGLRIVKCTKCRHVFRDYEENDVYSIIGYKDGRRREYCYFCAVMKLLIEGFVVRFDMEPEELAEFVDKYNVMVCAMLVAKRHQKVKAEVENNGRNI